MQFPFFNGRGFYHSASDTQDQGLLNLVRERGWYAVLHTRVGHYSVLVIGHRNSGDWDVVAGKTHEDFPEIDRDLPGSPPVRLRKRHQELEMVEHMMPLEHPLRKAVLESLVIERSVLGPLRVRGV